MRLYCHHCKSKQPHRDATISEMADVEVRGTEGWEEFFGRVGAYVYAKPMHKLCKLIASSGYHTCERCGTSKFEPG